MVCKHCSKEIKNGEKAIETVYGLLCESCYDKVLRQVQQNENIKCLKCGRVIGTGDYYVKMQDNKTLCVNCFKNSETNDTYGIKSNIDASHGMSTFINIIGISTIIVGFILGLVMIGTAPLIYIIGGLIAGAIFLGLGKIVYASEIYIWKNK